MRPLLKYFAAAGLALLVFGCGKARTDDLFATKSLSGEEVLRFRIETVAAGLEVPWGFAFLPNGDLLFTERPGRVRIIESGKLRAEPVFRVPDVEPSGESGLMDIALHPDFGSNSLVYLAYAYRSDGKQVRIVRYRFDGKTLTEPKTVIEAIPAAPNHAGTRARFGPDRKLYVTTGDATKWDLAQDNNSLAGKTLRLNDDGTVPEDNPFVGKTGYRPEIYTTGHRNAQGLTWSSAGLMFQTEHGPSGFEGRGGGADEVNFVERGKNYGWPEIYGTRQREGMVAPLLEYSPSCAPGSALVYRGDRYPQLRGDLFVGCLRGARMIRIRLDGSRVVAQEDLFAGKFGRIREIGESPDGHIYFSTSNRDGRGSPAAEDDRIVRIVGQ